MGVADTFEKLFGITKSSVQETCVLLPLVSGETLKCLGVKGLSRGALYSAANSRLFTVVHTRVGPAFTGDAALHLGETACRNVILFGSCGSAGRPGDPPLGAIVSPFKCYEAESFSRLLMNPEGDWAVFYADRELHGGVMRESEEGMVRDATCLSIGSLKMQEDRLETFRGRGVGVFDMECASLYAAARCSRRRAVGLLYVTDIVGEKPFYREARAEERELISSAAERAAHILCNFVKNELQ